MLRSEFSPVTSLEDSKAIRVLSALIEGAPLNRSVVNVISLMPHESD